MVQTRGIRNNNPVNIRKGSRWLGLADLQSDPEFCTFQSMSYGVRAAIKLLRNYISGWGGRRVKCNSIFKIINNWAPPSENNTANYIKFVSEKAGIHPYQALWVEDDEAMFRILAAMCLFESQFILSRDFFNSAKALL